MPGITQAVVLLLALALPATAARMVLLIAGPKSHGPGQHEHPAGCELLARHLIASGLEIEARVAHGWPQDAAQVAAADALVIYSDGGDTHVARDHLAALRARHAAGKGLAVLHYALEPSGPEMAAFLDDALGGHFDPAWSVNPLWKLEHPMLARHPLTSGVEPFAAKDEFYFHLRFREGVTPVLRALPPVSTLGADGPRSGNPEVRRQLAEAVPQTLAWLVENPTGARGFGFTGGHFHHLWGNQDIRKLVLNGIAWTAGIEIPADGVPDKAEPAPVHASIDEAIAKGDLDDVKRHLARNPGCLHKGGRPNSRPPLEQAILRNKTEIAIHLIDAGADPAAPNAAQRAPLHLAIERNNPAVVAALLKAGADPSPPDKDGWTPLHHAAAKNQLENARLLLDGGARPMALSKLGGSPLHEAAASGGADIIRLLLASGCDPQLKSRQNVTALDLARQYGNQPAIEVLSGPLSPAP